MTGISKVKDLIARSGNSFHAKVARWFSENGWHVIVSPYYLDQSQNKAREIDLVVEKDWSVYHNNIHGEIIGEIVVRLFVECKYLSGQSVFWFADKDLASATELVCSRSPFKKNSVYTDKHHYLSLGKVAKVFSSGKAQNSEQDPFYKALNQSLNGMVSMCGLPVSIPQFKTDRKEAKAVVEFPVVVCNSFADVYSVDFYNDSEPELISKNFQIEVQYAYVDSKGKRQSDYFLLDVVEFDKLGDYIQAIGEDALAAVALAESGF